jgi:signal transduction histidine kinase
LSVTGVPGNENVLTTAAARLSHEIKNSLTGIAGALDVLSDRLSPNSEMTDVLSRIRTEVDRIDQSVKELTAFANPKIPILRRRNIHDVIDRAIARARLRATTRVARDYGKNLPPIRVDEQLLVEALARMFSNAQDVMPAGGELRVRTLQTREHLVLTVRDTGPGIRAGDLENVFQPFVSSKTRGLGLGLAIIRRVVQAHGGTVSASSVDGGAEFTIHLPVSS